MTTPSIVFQGQKLSVRGISDLDMAFISQMYDEQQRPIFDTQKMSQAIERIVEAICPKFPPKYYTVTKIGRYLWLGDASQFAELLMQVSDCWSQHFASLEVQQQISEEIESLTQAETSTNLLREKISALHLRRDDIQQTHSFPEIVDAIDAQIDALEKQLEIEAGV